MKKKLFVLTVAVILIMTMSMALLVGCGGKPMEFGEQTIGTEAPANTAYSIESGMSAFEMLEVGVKNYYDADVAVVAYRGSVVTTILGGIKVTQNVISNKIRVGKGDEGGNNANAAKYFADNQSYGYTSLYEKMIIDGNDVTYKTSSSQKYDEDNGVWKKVKWKDDESYDSVAALEEAKNNNPTVLWMYDLQADFVLEEGTTAPELKDGVYTFTLNFDPLKSTVEYQKTMQTQLEVNAGMKVSGLTFETLKMKVELWENGAIKRIFITESYFMNMAGVIKSSITLNSDTQYAYEQVDGFRLQDHIDAFSTEFVE